jgi:hypothetical protein
MLYGELPVEGGFLCRTRFPKKEARLRLPNSAEILERLRSQKTLRTPGGRGQATTEPVLNDAADLALFAKLRVDQNGAEFDAAEARAILGDLLSCESVNCEPEGDGFAVTLKTPFGEILHIVRMPFERDMAVYRRTVFVQKDLARGKEELRWNPDAAVKLYDSLEPKSDGYAKDTPVPPHHKFAVAGEVARAMAEMDPLVDVGPNF